jgi:LemA protein
VTAVWVLLGLLVVAGTAVAVSYNRFVAQRAGVESSWSGVDVQLQRRHDLVPNLVETVRGYAAHERDVLAQVTRARTAAVEADRDPAAGPDAQARHEEALTAATHRLLAVAEGYPDLQAATGFRQLQAQLVETEDRIAASRRLYNLEVRGLNRRVEAFPSNVVASTFGFARAEYFELTDPGAAAAPVVET